jgi:hypothetical protein
MKWFRIVLLTFFLSIGIGAAILSSNPCKKIMESTLRSAIASTGLQVENISGNLPFQIHLKNVEIEGAYFDDVDASISLIYLIKKELYIHSLKATGFRLPKTTQRESGPTKKLPLTVTIPFFTIQGELNFTGSAQLQKNGAGFLKTHFTQPEVADANLAAELNWNEHHSGKASIYGSTPTLQVLAPWVQTTQEGALEFQASATGSLEEFSGKIRGYFLHKEDTFEGAFVVSNKDQILKGQGTLQVQLPQGLVCTTIEAEKLPAGLQTQIHWHSKSLKIEDQIFSSAVGSIQGLYAKEALVGNTELKATWKNEEWEVTSPFVLRLTTSLLLEDIQLQSALAKAKGNLAYRIPEEDFTGKFHIEHAKLNLVHQNFDGIGSGTIWFDQTGFYADIIGKELFYNFIYADTASLHKAPGELKISVENGRWNAFTVSTANLQLQQDALHFTAIGLFNEPFDLQINGMLNKNQFTLQKLQGTLATEPISSSHSTTLNWTKHSFQCSPLLIQVGSGSLFFKGIQTREKTDINLTLNKFPLNNFALNSLDVPISGEISLDSFFLEEHGQSSGTIKGKIDKGTLALKGSPESITINGNIEADFERNHLKGMSNLTVNQKPFLAIDFDIPLSIDPHGLKISPLCGHTVEGSISLHGQVEKLLDFVDFGTHRIEGNINSDLKLSGNLNHPNLVGSCEISNGRYQNYLTGTDLIDLNGTFVANGQQLILEKLTARDARNGIVEAAGIMQLSLQKNFPFQVSAEFKELEILQIDLINATAEGKIQIKGDLESATLTGTAEIATCNVSIPDTIPRAFPDLHVVYKNVPACMSSQFTTKSKKQSTPYPIQLDLRLSSQKGVFIDGRGIHSEWQGDFNLGGIYTNPSVNGKLELVHGEFLFAGKQFKLLDGSIGMQGKAYEMPVIDIAANTSEKGISITARIKGPLNTPQLTFQSSPPLPLSSIVSYLIFGKDLAEVSGIQALQLASTVATIAGEGPDILEMTRKTLGVDRLQIVMTPQSLDPGADRVTLEVGKVIFPGFLVTLLQGAEDDSTNIRIEVDLTHGFTFGLESQQLPEQGKFSLNWNINY